MTFTDDDLKRLKERISFVDLADTDEIPRLLARLEAAEKVCQSCEMEMMEKHYDSDALVAWRKAAGK